MPLFNLLDISRKLVTSAIELQRQKKRANPDAYAPLEMSPLDEGCVPGTLMTVAFPAPRMPEKLKARPPIRAPPGAAEPPTAPVPLGAPGDEVPRNGVPPNLLEGTPTPGEIPSMPSLPTPTPGASLGALEAAFFSFTSFLKLANMSDSELTEPDGGMDDGCCCCDCVLEEAVLALFDALLDFSGMSTKLVAGEFFSKS